MPDKPSHCTCAYPQTRYPNASGHAASCPCYDEHFERLADPRQTHTDDNRQRHQIPPFRRPR